MKISVLMTVYNGRDKLPLAIESILTQTFSDFKFIIVDDGSTDNSSDVLARYASRDARIQVTRQDNKGLTVALNVGLKAAKGTYIARQDADDISLPTRLEKQVKWMDGDQNLVLVGCDYNVIDDNGEYLVTIRNSKKNRLVEKLVRSNPFCHGTLMFRRLVAGEPVFYHEYYKKAQDRDLVFRLSQHGEIAIVPEVLYQWRFSRHGILATNVIFYGALARENHLRRLAGRLENFSPPTEEQVRPRPSNGHFQMALGARYLSGYRTAEARRCFLQACREFKVSDSEYLKCLKLLAASCLPQGILRRVKDV